MDNGIFYMRPDLTVHFPGNRPGEVAGEIEIAKPERPQLEALEVLVIHLTADRDLGAAPANIDKKCLFLKKARCSCDPEIDQPGLLPAGDNTDIDLRLLAEQVEEFILVSCLSQGRGGDGNELLGRKCTGHFPQALADSDRPFHRYGKDLLFFELAFTKPDLLLLLGEHGIGMIRVDPHD